MIPYSAQWVSWAAVRSQPGISGGNGGGGLTKRQASLRTLSIKTVNPSDLCS